ncbi:MAG: methyl-accepting chemotaxis protein [Heteroscytonema crispum UTEX LB 1556]
MAASIDDYAQTYQQALAAYAQQNYEEAATLVDQVVQNVPNDPSCRLLRGHVYYVLQQYDVAEAEYRQVLQLSSDRELIDYAKNGLQSIKQYQQELGSSVSAAVNNGHNNSNNNGQSNGQVKFSEMSGASASDKQEFKDLAAFGGLDSNSFDINAFVQENQQGVDVIEELPLSSPFDIPTDSTVFGVNSDSSPKGGDNPFASLEQLSQEGNGQEGELELPSFWQDETSGASFPDPGLNSTFQTDDAKAVGQNSPNQNQNNSDLPFAELDLPASNSLELPSEFFLDESYQNKIREDLNFKLNSIDDETLLMDETTFKNGSSNTNNFGYSSQKKVSSSSSFSSNFTFDDKRISSGSITGQNSFEGEDSFDLEAFESAFGSDVASENTNSIGNNKAPKSNNIEFLNDFDEFDDLGNIPGFDLTTGDSSFGEMAMPSISQDTSTRSRGKILDTSLNEVSDREDELFSITGSSQEAVPVFTQADVSKIEPTVNVEQGILAPLENAPLENKQWFIAGTVGVTCAVVVAVVSFAAATFSEPQQRQGVRNTGWAMALAAGLTGFGTAGFMGNLTLKQIRRTTRDLQSQFDAVRQGNLHVQATVYSEDELGQLAAGFNEMARVIFTTTNEAQRKADEQEEAKENLQRQVIRLLDDVEGAARGDLTVQAEVTADVLGAVADAFNLTIQNLRDIVQQVKVAAREVTKGATNSETFARALSSDALRQAEELAVTLNSVQVMTDSIQRVAEAAREAETVARDASAIALKGGEAVENTVAGILEIRETVAETTRKVKRLAESSQEISKIVALISQIASRTNLLALNASIEAARAGEAGRGFAIVADEVRQLADKSAKSLKEIEQIVMQIQSETGSVMTAMEEGTQQVIKGTKLAEEAKRSLENIIQVANRIDIIVRSITTDTVEQTETSRAVAQVMQSVELTAQETSQEAQRVSGALQHLVGVSCDLIASVERFRVETLESR